MIWNSTTRIDILAAVRKEGICKYFAEFMVSMEFLRILYLLLNEKKLLVKRYLSMGKLHLSSIEQDNDGDWNGYGIRSGS